MILDLKGVFDCEGYRRDLSYAFSMADYTDKAGEFPFKEPVRVSATVENRAGVVSLHVETQTQYFTQCDRCCEPLTEPLAVLFDNCLVRQASGEGDNEDIIVVEDDRLDLDELVYSNIVLSLPMKHLCSEDCKGICPVCGKNRNERDCECDRGGKKSPFAILKDLEDL
jgi:Predicted metal-binding, possibly nucleic acid-binding protein